MKPNSDQPTKCNFCNKDTTQVKKLLAGESGTHICSECVELCYGIVTKKPNITTTIIKSSLKVPTPREIHKNSKRKNICSGQDLK